MVEQNENPVICPFCGSANPVGSVFCQDCGKKFSGQSPTQPKAKNDLVQTPQYSATNYQPTNIKRSHRTRNIAMVAIAGILIASLLFASGLLFSANINNTNSLATPSPSIPASPTSTPTLRPTIRPTAAPTSTPQPPNNTITAINLQFIYQSVDQGYFGPNSQTFNFSNQPNGMLSINQGTEFWYSFKLTMASPASPDSISNISVSTPGFSLISVEPTMPIAYTQGSSMTITVHVQTPPSPFQGAVTLILTTLG